MAADLMSAVGKQRAAIVVVALMLLLIMGPEPAHIAGAVAGIIFFWWFVGDRPSASHGGIEPRAFDVPVVQQPNLPQQVIRVGQGLIISVVELDEDYLGIEISAANSKFAGAAFIYAGVHELSEFASQIDGFPTTPSDERFFEFGSRAAQAAGGFAALRFRCVDRVGHAALELELEDQHSVPSPVAARFGFLVEAAELDRFVAMLRQVDESRVGQAVLAVAV